MDKVLEEDLLNLLEEILSDPMVSTSPNTPAGPFNLTDPSGQGSLYQTASLLILEARGSASLIQLIDILLQVLLSQPPFTHKSTELLFRYRSRFFVIWSRAHDEKQRLQPQDSLRKLVEIRMNFQRLEEDGFRFVSELILSCLEPLLSEKKGPGYTWMAEHEKAVMALTELLYSVPEAGWLRMGKNYEYTVAIWKCLKLLTVGALWWELKSERFKKNMLRLSKCFFALPTVSSLLRTAVRVEIKPAQIFSVIDILLTPLERHHGVVTSDGVKSFTPTPFKFPVFASLDKHHFSGCYEFANLRILFVSWINSDPIHRDLDEFCMPWSMGIVLQHPEAFNQLKLHPDSAIRIALTYIFNEVKMGGKGFKPSTDMKAVELLKIVVVNKGMELSSVSTDLNHLECSSEACVSITKNAEWVLPWLWERRATDIDFVMSITGAWMLAIGGDGKELDMEHPVLRVLEKNRVVFDVFTSLFKHVFVYGGDISNSNGPSNLCRRLELTLKMVGLISASKPEETNPELCSQIIQCFADSVEHDWIPTSCWELVCTLFATMPMRILEEAFAISPEIDKIDIFVQIFLRQIEGITNCCENSSVLDLPVEALANKFKALTALLQFVTLAGRVNARIRQFLSAKTHFILSMLKYVRQEYKSLLLMSSRPELLYMHAASVGAACEILIITEFGRRLDIIPGASNGDNVRIGSLGEITEDTINQENLKIISMLLNNTHEMSYIISPLCELTAMLNVNWWMKKPLIYLNVYGYIRYILLLETHSWCVLAPVMVRAVGALLRVDFPIRQLLVENRWNLELVAKMITRIKNGKMDCESCCKNVEAPIMKLVTLLLERRPRWCKDLLLESRFGQYSMLTFDIIHTIFQTQMEMIISSPQAARQHLEMAEMALRIVNSFPEWGSKPERLAMKRRLERSVIPTGSEKYSVKGVCDIFLPTEGVSFCLVPS